jgi:hypothetical protein
MPVRLSPSQQRGYDELRRLLPLGNVFVLAGNNGVGRTTVLRRHLAGLPRTIGAVDEERLARETEGFTGADLKRLIEDGKALLAYDRANGLAPRPATEYFVEAVQTVRANKQCYADAESRAHSRLSPMAAKAAMMAH